LLKKLITMERKKTCCGGLKGIILGLIVVAAGSILLARNLELIDPFYSEVFLSWPMLIIAFGLLNLFGKEFPFGLLIMIVGGLFLASKFFGLPINVSQILWPGLIILFGIIVIIGSRVMFKFKFSSNNNDSSYIEEVAIFGGSEHIVTSNEFKGGKFVCIFGGSNINLLQTDLSTNGANIELVCIFGGVNFTVPSDWSVKTQVVSIFGGFADKRIITASSPNKLISIKGVCIFGGGEVKSIPD